MGGERRRQHGGAEAGDEYGRGQQPAAGYCVKAHSPDEPERQGHDGGAAPADGVGEAPADDQARRTDAAEYDEEEPGGTRFPRQVIDQALEYEIEGGR